MIPAPDWRLPLRAPSHPIQIGHVAAHPPSFLGRLGPGRARFFFLTVGGRWLPPREEVSEMLGGVLLCARGEGQGEVALSLSFPRSLLLSSSATDPSGSVVG